MKDFKKASTLHENYSERRKPSRSGASIPTFHQSKIHMCEHHTSGLCEASREAFRLGLRKTVFPCTGNIPPDCIVRQKLAAGMTIQEVLGES